MPPTPITADGLLTLQLEVASQPHEINMFCSLDAATDYETVLRNSPLSGSDPGDTVAERFWLMIKHFWPSSVPAPGWVLSRRIDNIYVPVASGSCTGTGDASASIFLTSQATYSFRDTNQYLMRLQMPETIDIPPGKNTYGGMSGDAQDFVDDVLAAPDGTKLSTWIRVRTGTHPSRFLFFSSDINDKYRRARGL
jgi:hypothetical protein